MTMKIKIRRNMPEVWYSSQNLVIMKTLFYYWISTVCIPLLYKNLIFVSLQWKDLVYHCNITMGINNRLQIKPKKETRVKN